MTNMYVRISVRMLKIRIFLAHIYLTSVELVRIIVGDAEVLPRELLWAAAAARLDQVHHV